MQHVFHMGPARRLGIELLAVSWEFQSQRTKKKKTFSKHIFQVACSWQRYWFWNILNFYLSTSGSEIPQGFKICADSDDFSPDQRLFGRTVIQKWKIFLLDWHSHEILKSVKKCLHIDFSSEKLKISYSYIKLPLQFNYVKIKGLFFSFLSVNFLISMWVP